jgi:hypothetical protein
MLGLEKGPKRISQGRQDNQLSNRTDALYAASLRKAVLWE